MKKCPNCQRDNPAEALFCNYCGSKLSISCPQCGTENNVEARFCQQCGSKLREGDEPGKVVTHEDKKKVKKEAERRQLTILFCDLVGSTSLSENLDPEEFRKVITDYHQVAEKVIKENGGFIAQYLGDGLLTYFGYPEGLEDAPRAGVRTGLGIIEAMAEANRDWETDGKTSVDVRIGLHTGLVVVDEHLALGETVNIAARLEGFAPHNGVVISPQSYPA
jgi:class 3 adenylate cyclase